ncbi:MAG TPA: PQQ-binding-like beta-propeller repeat protein [Pyrinomonadaceae bacterium]|nr:PQQ-binding-like beta-propeller repeat protein [Pyrinomonadaceae bacterium]
MKLSRAVGLSLFVLLSSLPALAQSWTAKLDKDISFYQPTEMGVLIVGTEKSLYAIDASTGDTLWRRKDTSLDETDVAPVPGTDLLLLSFEKGDKARIEAVDILTGDSIWRSEKIKGAVMQTSVDTQSNLLAVVLAKDAKNRPRDGFKRRPLLHVLDLATGDELWKYDIGEVEMMPARWLEDSGKEVDYTLDNYYPPAFIDGRLYVFYEGVTSFDARSGKERLREKYRVNEDGFALTEAEPIFTDTMIYVSGHGRVRAISRQSGDTEWEAKDLGLTPEMVLVGDVLYVRTGGQFTRLKDGETTERGSYGVSAIDVRSGKVVWRYKGADKGITNLVMPDRNTIVIADRDDLIFIDASNGKRLSRVSHKIERPSFGTLNESGNIVIGGQSEIAAFNVGNGRELWRARHTPPGRGIFRTVAAIAARAASLYFRFGGLGMTAFRGVQIAQTVTSLSWSGLASRSSFSNLQALATASNRRSRSSGYKRFGIAKRVQDRIDPSRQLDRLSRFLWHRERLATLQGQWMYFYTNLDRGGNGLAGVNINNGRTDREVRLSDLDERFVTDEVLGAMFTSSGNKIFSHGLR